MNISRGIKGFISIPVEDRFWEKVDKRGDDECWPWKGSTDGYGRGQLWTENRNVRATRVAWEIAHKKQFPTALLACHSCDNPNCVNPKHIWPGTMSDNIRDCVSKGRHVPFIPQKQHKIECANGHAYTDGNTYIGSSGRKSCRICRRVSQLRYERRQAARAAKQGG